MGGELQGPLHNVGPAGGDSSFLEKGLGDVVKQIQMSEVVVIVADEVIGDVP